MSGEKQAKRSRRAERDIQPILHQEGVAARVMAAYDEMKRPLFQAQLRSCFRAHFTAWTKEAIVHLAERILREHGIDLADVKIICDQNPITGALMFKADASDVAVERACAKANRRAFLRSA